MQYFKYITLVYQFIDIFFYKWKWNTTFKCNDKNFKLRIITKLYYSLSYWKNIFNKIFIIITIISIVNNKS